MKHINPKKAIYIIILLISLQLLFTAILVIFVDPFFQYHKPISSLNYVIDNQLAQNAGMLKNFDYDSVILGSSMTVNFDTNLFKEYMDLNTIKASANAAYPKDISISLSLIKKERENINTVFIGIDPINYHSDPEITAYPYPKHLYDDNLLNDAAYLFNKDVILDYILKPQILKRNTKINEVYWFWKYMSYGKESIKNTYSAPQITNQVLPSDTYLKNTEYNINHYIIPYIETMEDTQFVFFFPPYSILYWYNCMAEGSIDAYMAEIEMITQMLLSYPNVKIFYFQNEYDLITDLNNYCDYTHYHYELNNYMTKCFSNGTNELTLKNYKTILEETKNWFLSYDYKNCW